MPILKNVYKQQNYSLRDRSHNLQLPTRTSSLKENNYSYVVQGHDFYLCIFSMTLFYPVLLNT